MKRKTVLKIRLRCNNQKILILKKLFHIILVFPTVLFSYIYMCVCVCVCVCVWIFRYERKGIQFIILVIIELFANVKCFSFYTKPASGQLIWDFMSSALYLVLNETKKKLEILSILFPLEAFCFETMWHKLFEIYLKSVTNLIYIYIYLLYISFFSFSSLPLSFFSFLLCSCL